MTNVTSLPGVEAEYQQTLRVSQSALDNMPRRPRPQAYVAPQHPDSVFGNDDGGESIAHDSDITATWAWAQAAANSAVAEGTTFLGYSALALLAQRAEYRVISETIAAEMTREWIELKSTGEEDKSERIAQLGDELTRLGLKDICREGVLNDGFFGRGHIYIDTGDTDDRDELKIPIGNGWDLLSRAKIGVKPTEGAHDPAPVKKLQALRSVEHLARWLDYY